MIPQFNKTNLPPTLRRVRRMMGFTQAELAAHIGVSRPSVERWEQGRTVPRNHGVVQKIAQLEAYYFPLPLKPIRRSDANDEG